jgi:hypothetical protein
MVWTSWSLTVSVNVVPSEPELGQAHGKAV